MEAAARLLRPRHRKRNKSSETSPRRGRVRQLRENSGSASGSLSTLEEAEVSSARSLPNYSAGITRTSSLPGLPERVSLVSSEDAGSAEPSPLADPGNMSTDVSDSFKRAFQEMATERETLRKTIDDHKLQDQALAALKTDHEKVKESLEEARAQHRKELDRAVASSKAVSTLQVDIQNLKSRIASKDKEIAALKNEMASDDKKSVAELMEREKAAEGSMLRRAREIETLKKQLETTKKRLAEAEMEAVDFQKTSDRTAKQLQTLQESLRSEEMKRVGMETSMKRSQADLLERRKELSDMTGKLNAALEDAARLTREVRALEKAAAGAKCEGTDAASRISDLERKLSLRTDELKAAEATVKRAESDAAEAAGKLESTKLSLESARAEVQTMKESMTDSAKERTSKLSAELEDAQSKATTLEREFERSRKNFATELTDVRETLEKEVADLADKTNTTREELANAKLTWGRERRDLRLQVDQAQDVLAAKEREFRTLSIKLEDAKANAEDSKWHLDRANKKLGDAREAAAQAEKDYKDEITDLRERMSGLQATSRAAEKRASAAELALDEKKMAYESVSERLNWSDMSLNEWKTRASAAEQNAEEIRTQLGALQATNETLKTEAKALEDAVKLAKAEAEEANEKSVALNEELGACKEQLSDTKASFTTASNDLRILETSIAKREEEIYELRNQVARMTTANDELSASATRVVELESQLENSKTEVASLQDRLLDTESTAAGLEAHTRENTGMVRTLEQKLEKKEREHGESLVLLQEAQSEVAAKKEEVSALECRIAELTESVGEKESLLLSAEEKSGEVPELTLKLKASEDALEIIRSEVAQAQEDLTMRSVEALEKSKELDVLQEKYAEQEQHLLANTTSLEETKCALGSAEIEARRLTDLLKELETQRDTVIRGGDETKSILAQAEKDLAEQTSKASVLQAEKENFENEVTKLQAFLVEKEGLLQKNSEEYQNIQKALDTATRELSEAKERGEAQARGSAELSQRVTDLRAEVATKERLYSESTAEADKLMQQVEELSRDLSTAEAASMSLRGQVEDGENQRAALETESKQTLAALDATKAKLSELEKKFTESEKSFREKEKALQGALETSKKEFAEGSAQLLEAQSEIEILKTDRSGLQENVESLQKQIDDATTTRAQTESENSEKYQSLLEDRDALQKEYDGRVADVARLTKECEEANEQSVNVAKEMADTQQLADESQTRATQVEEELAKISTELQEMEWALNEETLRADNAEAAAQALREQGRNIYSKIEEFGEEAEARVIEVETELENAVQDIGVLQGRNAELSNELSELHEKEKDLKRKLDESLSEKASLTMDKEAAERRFEMANSEIKFHSDRLRTLEAQNKDLNSELDKAKVGLREVEDKLLRQESRANADKDRLQEFQAQMERMRGFESKFNASELELVRLRSQADQASAARARVELERDETARRLREMEQRHTQEKVTLMAERASFAETARKAQTDLEIRRDEIEHYRSALSSTGSGRHTGESNNVKNNIVVGGATAVVGGVSLFALKLLAKAMAQPKT